MNKFQAMSKVLCNAKMNVRGNEWFVMFQGKEIASVSKSNGKYFAHYKGRKTALVAHPNFMKAIAEIMPLYLELYNADKIATASFAPLFDNGIIAAYVGSDDNIYTKVASVPGTICVQGNVYNHLNKYYSDVVPSDMERAAIAESIDNAWFECWVAQS